MHIKFKNLKIIPYIIAFLIVSCSNNANEKKDYISLDSLDISIGRKIFLNKCASCHNFRQDGIGPSLNGVTINQSKPWLIHFISNPQLSIEKRDTIAIKLYKRFHTIMPSFSLSVDSMEKVLAYINSKKIDTSNNKPGSDAIKNPFPDTISSSGIQASLKLIGQVPASDLQWPHTRIIKIGVKPESNDLYILDQRGKLYRLANGHFNVYMDMAKLKLNFINHPGLATGFGSFAFHPDFKKNGLLYTSHSEKAGSEKADFPLADSVENTLQWVLTEWKVKNPFDTLFNGTGREILRIDMASGIHGVQDVTFNINAKKADEDFGKIYIGIGDGGSVETGYPYIAHNLKNLWGTIIRIDPAGHNSQNGKYGIPVENPFVHYKNDSVRTEIYAYGFRNPNKFCWTSKNFFLTTNIGQANIESIDLIEKGHDYGWPFREGPFVLHPDRNINFIYKLPLNDSIYHFTYPVAAYDHDEGNAISGGCEYLGLNKQLKNKYIFGDIVHGRLFYIDINQIRQGKLSIIKEWFVSFNGRRTKLEALCGDKRVDLHFGKDNQGNSYLFTKPDGKIYLIE